MIPHFNLLSRNDMHNKNTQTSWYRMTSQKDTSEQKLTKEQHLYSGMLKDASRLELQDALDMCETYGTSMQTESANRSK